LAAWDVRRGTDVARLFRWEQLVLSLIDIEFLTG